MSKIVKGQGFRRTPRVSVGLDLYYGVLGQRRFYCFNVEQWIAVGRRYKEKLKFVQRQRRNVHEMRVNKFLFRQEDGTLEIEIRN